MPPKTMAAIPPKKLLYIIREKQPIAKGNEIYQYLADSASDRSIKPSTKLFSREEKNGPMRAMRNKRPRRDTSDFSLFGVRGLGGDFCPCGHVVAI